MRFDGADDLIRISGVGKNQGIAGDVSLATDIDATPIGTVVPGIDMYGHHLLINENSIECRACDSEEQIPKIVQESSELYQVVYKLYSFDKFKDKACEGSDLK